MSPLFQAAIETTEEAIYNSLCMAQTMTGYQNSTIHKLPLEQLAGLVRNNPDP
jgi:D-aminopeptidase